MYDLYAEAVKALPPKHIDHHESDLYLKRTSASAAIIAAFKESYKVEYGQRADIVKTFRSIHPDDAGAVWYEIPFHYAPYWEEVVRKSREGGGRTRLNREEIMERVGW